MSVNFNVVEGDYSKYDEFVELYNDYSISSLEIKRKLGNNAYERHRKEALKNGDIKTRPTTLRFGEDNSKYYHLDKSSGKYRVRKVKNGKFMSFGFFDTEQEAIDKVEELKEVDWNV